VKGGLKRITNWFGAETPSFSRNRAHLGLALLVFLGLLAGLVLWINPATADDRLNLVLGFAQILGGLILLGGLHVTYQGLQTSRRSLETTQQSQYSDRFFKAVEQLSHEHLAVRVGAIHVLGQLMSESSAYCRPAIDTLMHFVRERTRVPDDEPYLDEDGMRIASDFVEDDTRAALRALATRPALHGTDNREPLDFRRLDLGRADFSIGWLDKCDFRGANLQGASFQGALLCDARFDTASCRGCGFQNAELQGASFRLAELVWADLSPVDNEYRYEHGLPNDYVPNLSLGEYAKWPHSDAVRSRRGGQFQGTVFTGAKMGNCNVQGVDLTGAVGLGSGEREQVGYDEKTVFPNQLADDDSPRHS
jgi:hypothetical protein